MAGASGAVPTELLERARALRDGDHVPAPARDAATVALLRAGPDGPQVHLVVRQRGMVFGGMHAFPGGSVDPADATAEVGWAGPPASAFAAELGCDEPLARALVCAAVRETFEVISDARLDAISSTAWYGAANPNSADTIEVNYLDGNDQPYLEQKNGWSVDGTEFKVRIDAGVAPLDYRTLAKNPGQ